MASSAAVLAVFCAVATALMMTAPVAAQSEDLMNCQKMAGNVSRCVLKLGNDPLNPVSTGPTTPACCSLIKDAVSDQMECLCGVYIGFKNYTSTAPSSFDNSIKDCAITADFASDCAKAEKQLKDAGYIDGGSGNKSAGSGKNTGAAGKTATAGVFGIVIVTALTMLF